MINLLPEKAKHGLREERFARFLIVCGVTVSLIVSGGMFLLWIPWITLVLQEHELEKQLRVAQQSPLLMHVEEIEGRLSLLNDRLDAYERNQDEILIASRSIDAVRAHVGGGISLLFFSYTRSHGAGSAPQFSIEGVARDRGALVAFSDALDAEPMIENVRSPISNFLKESNIVFTLTFEIIPSFLRISGTQ
ncbi:MAG: hypothetical protein Q8O83_01420 [bacterium]|nr:hypothetical protein [bacterium]